MLTAVDEMTTKKVDSRGLESGQVGMAGGRTAGGEHSGKGRGYGLMGMRRGNRRVLGAAVWMIVVSALAGSALALTAKPSITRFTPTSGKVGTKVTITGKNLTGATAVRIGGLKTPYKVSSATKITATVPGPAATGVVTVTTKGGTAVSAKRFTVSAAAAPASTLPAATVYAPNGSGTLTASTTSVSAGSTGNTIAFTYTADAGGMFNGSIVITVPTGWTVPVTTAAPGCVSSSGGTSAVITIDNGSIYFFNLTLAAGASATVTYGAKSGASFTGATCGPNSGAAAPTSPGPYTFATQQKSTNDTTTKGGVLTPIAVSPTVTVT
jgi:large repetitive protein